MTGLWISISGGPLCNYMPVFLIILVKAPPPSPKRASVVVRLGPDRRPRHPLPGFHLAAPLVRAGDINPFSRILENSPLDVPRG